MWQSTFKTQTSFCEKANILLLVAFSAVLWVGRIMAATAALLPRGIERSSHHGILAAFGEHLVKPGLVEPRFHTYIREAFARRSECDYLSFTTAEESEAKTTLKRAKELVEVCRLLCK
jgi:uncharacterized protein (UPF0332 family)